MKNVASYWLKILEITNHSNELLKQISKETRNDIKEFEKKKKWLLFKKRKEKFQIDKISLLLQSKYIYCLSLIIFEKIDEKEFILKLNRKEIEINEYSITHILNSHFEQIVKSQSKKSFHSKDFEPECLSKKLKLIFDEIDNSRFLTSFS